jgi:hypothetical protein
MGVLGEKTGCWSTGNKSLFVSPCLALSLVISGHVTLKKVVNEEMMQQFSFSICVPPVSPFWPNGL